jgi:hypothetical protein
MAKPRGAFLKLLAGAPWSDYLYFYWYVFVHFRAQSLSVGTVDDVTISFKNGVLCSYA